MLPIFQRLLSVLIPLGLHLLLAYTWIHSAWGKFVGPGFRDHLGQTLIGFAQNNPHTWYTNSVLALAQNHIMVFGNLVRWGEALSGIGLLLGAYMLYFSRTAPSMIWAKIIIIGALVGGMLLSLNFYFAAGWTSPSTRTLNLILFWAHALLLFYWATLLWRTPSSLE